MHVPTVGDVLNEGLVGGLISDEHVNATCFCCGVSAPLSTAVRLEKSGALFYRCGTCDEPVAMVSRLLAAQGTAQSTENAWAIYPLAPLNVGNG